MKKNRLLYSFISIILIFSFFDLIKEDKKFSEFENRKLNKKPSFTFESYLNGEFSKSYDKYVSDQFIMRDQFITLKSLTERGFLKTENNGIYFGDDGYLLEKVQDINKEKMDLNINSINKFIKETKKNIYLMIVPNSYNILKDKLPKYALTEDTDKNLDYIYSKVNGEIKIDLRKVLKENKEKYIYYKTDHHWTTFGAYLAYKDLMKKMKKEELDLKLYKENKEENFFGTFYSKSKPAFLKGDTIIYYDFQNLDVKINGEKKESIYNFDFFKTRDKYAFFLNDNNGITTIKNKEIKNGEKILVLKDSFANSLVPFLTNNFEEVIVIDLRYYPFSVKDYIKENNIKDILILYNFLNFTKDNSISKINN